MSPVLSLEMLPADYGDCLHLTYGESGDLHHVWIDGGLARSYRRGWAQRVREMGAAGQSLDLLVVTHIDNDHVAGVRTFVADNGADPFLPIHAVWFNQYRHIRAFASPEPGPAGPETTVRPRFFQATGRWRSRAEFVSEVARHAPGLAGLAGRLAATLPPMGGLARRGLAEGRELSELLSGAYPSNAAFSGQAAVRVGAPPAVDLPGGARVWILAPTPDQLERLYGAWRGYLLDAGLAPLLQVRGTGPMTEGEALVPAFVEALMLQRAAAMGGMAIAGREDDLALPIEELAARPFEADTSTANGSSIAMLFEFAGRRLLLAGDAPPDAVAEGPGAPGLQRAGAGGAGRTIKLAHHGSRANTSDDLLAMMRCDRYLISTNGVRFRHPDKECLARVIWANRDRPDTALYFNYPGTAAAAALDDAADRGHFGYRLVELGEGEALELGDDIATAP